MTEFIGRTLPQLRQECARLGICPPPRSNKTRLALLLGEAHWRAQHGPEPMPVQVMPMLVEEIPIGWNDPKVGGHPAWVIQPKIDGMRAIVIVDLAGHVRITSRRFSVKDYRLVEHQDRLPHLAQGFDLVRDSIFDGEIAFGSRLVHGANVDRMAMDTENTAAENIELHLFDCLRLSGRDLREDFLGLRLQSLKVAMDTIQNPQVRMVPTFKASKVAIHNEIMAAGGEGTVIKSWSSPYRCGRRSAFWIKKKMEF